MLLIVKHTKLPEYAEKDVAIRYHIFKFSIYVVIKYFLNVRKKKIILCLEVVQGF